MHLADAIRQLTPLQARIPNRHKPLQLDAHCAAEVFLVETAQGAAVVWAGPFWCEKPDEALAHIAYSDPTVQGDAPRWVDDGPRFGPSCIPYQKPFVMERVDRESPLGKDYRAWQTWRAMKGKDCGRRAAWGRICTGLPEIIERRLT